MNKRIPIEEAMRDSSGLHIVAIPIEIKESLYSAVESMMILLTNIDRGCTYHSMARDYSGVKAHLANFERKTKIGKKPEREGTS